MLSGVVGPGLGKQSQADICEFLICRNIMLNYNFTNSKSNLQINYKALLLVFIYKSINKSHSIFLKVGDVTCNPTGRLESYF